MLPVFKLELWLYIALTKSDVTNRASKQKQVSRESSQQIELPLRFKVCFGKKNRLRVILSSAHSSYH